MLLNPTKDNLFGPTEVGAIPSTQDRHESPERHPITGLVKITVSLNESRPRGFAVEVEGAIGLDLSADVLGDMS